MRNFRKLWWASALGNVGENAAAVALGTTAVTFLQATAWEVSIIIALSKAAYLVLGIPIGVWVDAAPKRLILVWADLTRFATVLSIPSAFLAGVLSIPQLMICSGILSITNALFNVAHTAILPMVVGKLRVSEATARLQTSDSVAGVAVPALSGQLAAATAGPVVYLVTASLHAVSSVLALRLRPAEYLQMPPETTRDPFWKAFREGLRFAVTNRTVRTLMASGAVVNFGAGIYNAQYALFILQDLGLSALDFGIAMAVGSAGGVIGSFLAVGVKNRFGQIRAQLLCYGLLTIPFICLALVKSVPQHALIGVSVSLFLLGTLLVVTAVCGSGIYAYVTPGEILGRVTGARRFLTLGVVPLGALTGGLLSSTVGPMWGIACSGLFPALAALLFFLSPLSGAKDLSDITQG